MSRRLSNAILRRNLPGHERLCLTGKRHPIALGDSIYLPAGKPHQLFVEESKRFFHAIELRQSGDGSTRPVPAPRAGIARFAHGVELRSSKNSMPSRWPKPPHLIL